MIETQKVVLIRINFFSTATLSFFLPDKTRPLGGEKLCRFIHSFFFSLSLLFTFCPSDFYEHLYKLASHYEYQRGAGRRGTRKNKADALLGLIPVNRRKKKKKKKTITSDIRVDNVSPGEHHHPAAASDIKILYSVKITAPKKTHS